MKSSTGIALVLFTVTFRHVCFRVISKYPRFGVSLIALPGFLVFSNDVSLVGYGLVYNLYTIATCCESLLIDID